MPVAGGVERLVVLADALKRTLATVPGIQQVILGEPSSLHALPEIYLVLDRFERDYDEDTGSITKITWYFQAVLCVLWHDPEAAERAMLGLLPRVAAAIEENAQLGGALRHGSAWAEDGDAGWRDVGGVTVREVGTTVALEEWVGYPES